MLMAFTGCASHESPPANPAEIVPKKLYFNILSIDGPSYRIELSEGYVTYSVKQPGKKATPPLHIAPTGEKWREFRHELDRLKVWRWKPGYGGKNLIEGTQWKLDIEYSDRAIHTEGHRDFPNDYDSFLKAVGKLLGSGEIQ